jgi:TPR repeat protein
VLLHPPDQLLFDTNTRIAYRLLIVYWYQKAADQGYAEAQSILGVMYANGKGVLKDDKQAVYWYPITQKYSIFF